MTEANRNTFAQPAEAEFIDWRRLPSSAALQGVVAVGNFDGVHLGHAALVRQLRELAASAGGPAVIVTFDPHPLQLLDPSRFQPQLTTAADRAHHLRAIGADAVVFLQTDAELLGLGPVDFFRTILIERFQARGVVEGFNFRFGHDRAGSIETLRALCADGGLPFRVVEPFQLNGATVSSSRIREALAAGNVRGAAELMNRPYRLRGVVSVGAKRGRTIGFPTANLAGIETLLPAEGVYAVRAIVGNETFAGAANIGANPTFGDNARKVEVHLIGYAGDLYGQTIGVEFMERLRETRTFGTVEDLVDQMRGDVKRAQSIFENDHGNG